MTVAKPANSVAKPPSCDGNGWVLTGDVGNPEELQRVLDENAALKGRISALERTLSDQKDQTVSRVHVLSQIIQAQARTIKEQELQNRQNLRDSEMASDQIERLESKLSNAIATKDQYHNIILSLYGDLKNDEGIFKLTDTKNNFHAIIIDLYNEIFGQIDKIRTLEGESEEKTKLIRTLNESLKRREGVLQQFQKQQQQLELKEQELDSANSEISRLNETISQLNDQIEQLNSQISPVSTDSKDEEISRLNERISELNDEILSLVEQDDENAELINQYESITESQASDVARLRRRVKELEGHLDTLIKNHSDQKTVKLVQREAHLSHRGFI